MKRKSSEQCRLPQAQCKMQTHWTGSSALQLLHRDGWEARSQSCTIQDNRQCIANINRKTLIKHKEKYLTKIISTLSKHFRRHKSNNLSQRQSQNHPSKSLHQLVNLSSLRCHSQLLLLFLHQGLPSSLHSMVDQQVLHSSNPSRELNHKSRENSSHISPHLLIQLLLFLHHTLECESMNPTSVRHSKKIASMKRILLSIALIHITIITMLLITLTMLIHITRTNTSDTMRCMMQYVIQFQQLLHHTMLIKSIMISELATILMNHLPIEHTKMSIKDLLGQMKILKSILIMLSMTTSLECSRMAKDLLLHQVQRSQLQCLQENKRLP